MEDIQNTLRGSGYFDKYTAATRSRYHSPLFYNGGTKTCASKSSKRTTKKAVRCSAKTKEGKRCKRTTKSGKRCALH